MTLIYRLCNSLFTTTERNPNVIVTEEQKKKLLFNGDEERRGLDHYPVIKLFLPGTAFTWLLTELDPHYENMAFGLCDLGMGFPELGSVYLPEILESDPPFKVERDLHFKGKYPISVYARAARQNLAITDNPEQLKSAWLKPPQP